MGSLATIYTKAVYDNLRPLRANWDPAQPIRLGDFGLMDGEAFLRQGNVTDTGLHFTIGDVIIDDVGDQKMFTSSKDVSIDFQARGAAPSNPAVEIKAGLRVSFASAETAFFNAAHCSYEIIADKRSLGNQIMAAFQSGKWRREWAVVTDLVRSKSTTIAIASAGGASLDLEATGDVPRIDLADASIGFAMKSARNVGYQIAAQNGLTPLIGLSQIQSTFLWWSEKFKPLTADLLANPRRLANLQQSSAVQTEPDDQLHFGQLF